jgi:hypothetical protein
LQDGSFDIVDHKVKKYQDEELSNDMTFIPDLTKNSGLVYIILNGWNKHAEVTDTVTKRKGKLRSKNL